MKVYVDVSRKFCAIRSDIHRRIAVENLIRTLARVCLSERECACVYRHARTGMLMGCRDNSLDAPAKFAFSLVADVVQELQPPSYVIIVRHYGPLDNLAALLTWLSRCDFV